MIEILFYAAIVAFFFFQYRRVLGQRPDDVADRSYRQPAPHPVEDGKVITLSPQAVRNASGGEDAMVQPANEFPASLSGMLARVQRQDSRFSEKAFMAGARKAFERILAAYAADDIPVLEGLVADPALAQFRKAIEQRLAQGHTLSFTLHQIKDADLLKVSLAGSVATIDVLFISEETSVVRDAAGTIVSGDADEHEETHDRWVFRRDLADTGNSKWYLVETHDAA